MARRASLGRLAGVLLLLGACSSRNASGPPTPQSTEPSAPSFPAAPVIADGLPETPPDPREKDLSEAAQVLISKQHVLRRPIDDALSKEAFPRYLEELDGAKVMLLERDVEDLARYTERMDDELKDGDLVLARKGTALLQKRRQEVAAMIAEVLKHPFELTTAGTLETDPEKRTWCKDEGELRERWRGILKLQVLERLDQMEQLVAAKDAPKSPSEKEVDPKTAALALKAIQAIPVTPDLREKKAREELAVRYETRFTRLAKMEPLEPAAEFLNALNSATDPHTQYMPPSDKANFDIAISGTLEGIGAALGEQDHYVVVSELIPGGASWQQGKLEAGDLILAVAQAGQDPVDVTDMPIDKVVAMVRGPKGSVVTLTVKKADEHIETISIVRDVVQIEASYARGAVLKLPKGPPVGYIYLPSFYGDLGKRKTRPGDHNATDDVKALLVELNRRKVSSVIIDLRGNGGGLLNHATDISGLFFERGPVVQTKDAEGSIEVLEDEDPTVTYQGDVIVMVDRFSASAAEILAGALQDYDRALVVGTKTHGKGTVQAVIDLDRLASGDDPLGVYKVTIQQYFRVNGASVQLRGIVPDVELPDPAAHVESGEDKLPHPIPWSQVEPAPHPTFRNRWDKATLARSSAARVSASAPFDRVKAFSRALKSQRDATLEPLAIDAWKAARKRDKEALDALDPKPKEAKALFDVTALGGPESTDPRIKKKLDAWKDGLAKDIWLEEVLRISADMETP